MITGCSFYATARLNFLFPVVTLTLWAETHLP